MHLIKGTERWTCLGVAFAMALDMPYAELVERVGHNGSEILWPNLPEPLCRRGYHVQEMVRLAYNLGKRVTQFAGCYAVTPDGEHRHIVSQEDFLEVILKSNSGVLTGRGARNNHAVAWDHVAGKIYDPVGAIYAPGASHFKIEAFWMIS